MHSYNTLFNLEVCQSIVEDSIQLLYYSHIPTALVALLIGGFVMYKSRASLLSRLLFGVTASFALWSALDLVVWMNYGDAGLVAFAWSFFGIIHTAMYVWSLYFLYVFIEGRRAPVWAQAIVGVLVLPVVVFAPTSYHIADFDLVYCVVTEGNIYTAYYLVLSLCIVAAIPILVGYKWRGMELKRRRSSLLLAVGMEAFLLTFFFAVAGMAYLIEAGYILDANYGLEQYGLFSMPVLLAFLAYVIVKYEAFNIKLIATQALVLAIGVLVAAQFFLVQSNTNRALTAVTLIITGIVGKFLIRSVKLEIQHREEIEKLAKTLDETNGRQETLIHFIGHEVKGFLTKDAGAFAALSEGDLGALPETAKPFVASALQQSRAGADSVANILKASNLKKGTVSYDKKPFDMKELVASSVERAKQMAADKKLELSLSVAEGSYQMVGDGSQINDHVLRNLIENALNYTPAGTVAVSLKNEGGKVIFSVKDSGVGITDEDKKRLFTEGGHGVESQKVNAHSTGYGLYIAKQIVDAHGGSIRAESEGAGKGSTFIAEFPVGA